MTGELSYLSEGLMKLGINIEDEALRSMLVYKEKVLEKNKVMNLTAIKDDAEFIERNIIDSLSVIKYIPENASIIDVGTGAGIPGAFIKLAKPSVNVTFLDSVEKKLLFVREALSDMGVSGFEICHLRAEDAAKGKIYRESFDVCIARAVSVLPVLCEYCLPFIKKGGVFIAMKGKNAEKELKLNESVISECGGRLEGVYSVTLPYSQITMKPVIFSKTDFTPSKFPRSIKELNRLNAVYKDKMAQNN